MADEEVGDSGVGAPFVVDERPDRCPNFAIGEGAGERNPTPDGPIYLLDRGIKATAVARLVVRGTAGDASLPDVGRSAVAECARLLVRLGDHRSPLRVVPEVETLLDAVAPFGADAVRVADARRLHPALDLLLEGLVGAVIRPTVVEAKGPKNVVPEEARVTMQCLVLPRTARDDLERELRHALGEGTYELEVEQPQGGSLSPLDTPLHEAVVDFLAQHDPGARLVPALSYGFSDCHFLREAYGTVTYGFVPFRHADPVTNLTTKHGDDERVLVDDLVFQTQAALSSARAIGGLDERSRVGAATAAGRR
jgi:acetylornithine deacetylase/succinyl-diaminopimelate desuccinylase-like protein